MRNAIREYCMTKWWYIHENVLPANFYKYMEIDKPLHYVN